MKWTLGGRLKYTRTEDGLFAQISGAKYPGTVLFGLLWCIVSLLAIFSGSGTTGDAPDIRVFEAFLDALIGLPILTFSLLSGTTLVTLNEQELTIVRKRFGVNWRTRTFATSTIHNLSYLAPRWWAILVGSRPGEICFDCRDKTYRFGAGIGYNDAETLIREMHLVHKFPWNLRER